MAKLNQILAVEKGVKASSQRAVADAHHTIQKHPLLSGLSRTYQPIDDEGDQATAKYAHRRRLRPRPRWQAWRTL
uniref:DUF7873 family protein n=1 Tax=Nonomuraea bangladeshensis TaxID=404385 RepID=UPI003F4985E3